MRYMFPFYRAQHPPVWLGTAAWIPPFFENPLLPSLPGSLATLHLSAELSTPSSHTRVAVIAFGNRALATSFPLGGSHIVAIATEAELSGYQAVQVSEGMVGTGGRWRGWVRVLVRSRPPTASILGCCSVILGRVEGER